MEYEIIPSINEFKTYSRAEYDTNKPFETLAAIVKANPGRKTYFIDMACEYAKQNGIGNFKRWWNDYINNTPEDKDLVENESNNLTNFHNQPMELQIGNFKADSNKGIYMYDRKGDEVLVCKDPVMPIQRLENIDTGKTKYKITFTKGTNDTLGRYWRPPFVVDQITLASATKIMELNDHGITVDSESAKYLTRYFTMVTTLNYDTIPSTSSVGRLGWIKDTNSKIIGFAPYIDNVEFDGTEQFKDRYDAIKPYGDKSKWDGLVLGIRKNGTLFARIMLASAIGSILVEPCNCLPFFVHLWGGTEAGKTVALMLACSVWGNPDVGKYITTFNSTSVGQELNAAFCNSLPMIMDELQIQTAQGKKDFDSIIYQLAEGVGRTRGRKEGGLDKQKTWRNCFLTSGEFPISNSNSGGGSVNRVIELDCKDTKIFAEPTDVVAILRENFGFLGKEIVENLIADDYALLEEVKAKQEQIRKQLLAYNKYTDKQCASASIILVADWLIEKIYFKDGVTLTTDDIAPFLTDRDEISQNARCWNALYDFVAMNHYNFYWGTNEPKVPCGKLDKDANGNRIAHILRAPLERWCSDNGYNLTSFTSWCAMKGKLIHDKDKATVHTIRLNGTLTKLFSFKLEENANVSDEPNFEELPM